MNGLRMTSENIEHQTEDTLNFFKSSNVTPVLYNVMLHFQSYRVKFDQWIYLKIL